jgi:16S rRNA (guanine1516-N2)-methyltransferase
MPEGVRSRRFYFFPEVGCASGDRYHGTPAVNVSLNHPYFGSLPQYGPHDQPPVPVTVAVCTAESGEASQRKAAQLAKRFNLPHVESVASAYDVLLTVTAARLELRFPQRGGPRPLYVDFVGGALGYTRRVNRFGLLFQAVGFRAGRPKVLDATAGLGGDAFRLAYHGCQVTAVERSSLLFALFRDALDRAALVPDVHARIGDGLHLLHNDARDVLRQLSAGRLQNASPQNAIDVVYLDPMYPPQKKSALGKIEMRILRRLVGDDLDADELFELACAVACPRVVVKRPRHAEPLAPHPTHSHCDQTTRYDVYLRPRRS